MRNPCRSSQNASHRRPIVASPAAVPPERSDAGRRGHGKPASRGGDRLRKVAPVQAGVPPGLVSFDSSRMVVSKRAVVAAIPLRHLNRARLGVEVSWRVIGGTAREGLDYGGPTTGVETFVEGNTFRILYVPIVANSRDVGKQDVHRRADRRFGRRDLGNHAPHRGHHPRRRLSRPSARLAEFGPAQPRDRHGVPR